MNPEMKILKWRDETIIHRLWLERTGPASTRLCLKVVKDLGPEILYLNLACTHDMAVKAWKGRAFAVSDEFNDGSLYSQVRALLNLADGCVLWLVNHVQLPDGNKMSADKLSFVPNMHAVNGALVPLN